MNTLKITDYKYNTAVNGVFNPETVSFSIWIETGAAEEYGPTYPYSVKGILDIAIDKDSGEDGFVAPHLTFPPFEHLSSCVSVQGLVGKEIVETWKDPVKDDYRYFWEGTFGNDLAGHLTGNSIQLKEFTPQGFSMKWTADITEWAPEGKWGEKIGSMQFEGMAAFGGISFRVKNEGEEDGIIEKAFNVAIDIWNKNWDKKIKKVELGEEWYQVTYLPIH